MEIICEACFSKKSQIVHQKVYGLGWPVSATYRTYVFNLENTSTAGAIMSIMHVYVCDLFCAAPMDLSCLTYNPQEMGLIVPLQQTYLTL